MLYKKIHRQHVKQFRKGRKFRFYGFHEVKIIKEPYIDGDYIKINVAYDRYDNPAIISFYSGKLWHKNDDITWLED